MTNSRPDCIEPPNMSCRFRFLHPARPRNICGRPLLSDGYCVLHAGAHSDVVIHELIADMKCADHWAEGVRFSCAIREMRLSGAKIPGAVFEGLDLRGVALDRCLLDGANFRSTVLEGVSFFGARLTQSCFDSAKIIPHLDVPVDLRGADIGGATFVGAEVQMPRLQGIEITQPTDVRALLAGPCFEMNSALWDEAANAYSALARRAGDDLDVAAQIEATYLGVTCRHRAAINAGPVRRDVLDNWLVPSFRAGFKGIGWLAHRVAWGYGLRPARVLWTMMITIGVFGLVILPLLGVCEGPSVATCRGQFSLSDGLVVSFAAFTGIGFGDVAPATMLGTIAAGVEALLSAVLLSLYLVALTVKYVRAL